MKDQNLKQPTLNEVLLALKQDNIFLATSLIKKELDCTLSEAKKIVEHMKKRLI